MSSIALQSNVGGTGVLTLAAPNTNTNRTLTLPDSDGTLLNTASTIALANIPDSLITPAKLSQKLTSGTAVATTSGTAIDITGIPSWAKRVTVMLDSVSSSGTDNLLVQIGTLSGGIETTGYGSSSLTSVNAATSSGASSTVGFIVRSNIAAASLVGVMTITLYSGTTWVSSHSMFDNPGGVVNSITGAGKKTLTGTLDRVRLVWTGTNTFDAGSVNIMYE